MHIKKFLLFCEILGWGKDILFSKIYRKIFFSPRMLVAREILWPGNHSRTFLFPLAPLSYVPQCNRRQGEGALDAIGIVLSLLRVSLQTEALRCSSPTVCQPVEFT